MSEEHAHNEGGAEADGAGAGPPPTDPPATYGGPSRPFILRPVATTLLMLALLIAGLIAYGQLPLSALPQVDYPTIQVRTLYPGAAPDVMALTVTSPLERQFGQMPGLVRMTSNSSAGASVITLQFGLDLNLDVAEQEVQAAINGAQTLLPSDLPAPPVYAKVNPADAPIITLAVASKARSLGEVEGIVERQLSNKIGQESGVGLVNISGGQRPSVRITANPAALAAHGLSLETIRTAIGNANSTLAKGSFDGPTKSWTIDANDQLASAADYQNLIMAWTGGAPVRLSDVAVIEDSTENVRTASWMSDAASGKVTPAVILDVQRQPGANVIGTVDGIKADLPALEAQLPADVHVTLLTDRTEGIRSSVSDVQFELAVAVLLVVLVIFLFLGSLRATVVAGISVPLSLVGAFAAMYAFGFSINNLSLMALTIASGFVVDDAIVVIENIARHIEEGMAPFEAALKGASEIGFTIVSLTVSLVAVLIPLLFMGDVVGRLFREFAISLAVTIVLSAVVALTVVPMLAARWLKPPHEERPLRTSPNPNARGVAWFFDPYVVAFGRLATFQPRAWVVFLATLLLVYALNAIINLALHSKTYIEVVVLIAIAVFGGLPDRWTASQSTRPRRSPSRSVMEAFDRLAHAYGDALEWVLARAGLTLAVFAGSFLVTLLLFWAIPKDLFPTQDTGQINAAVIAPQDVSFARMARLQGGVAEALLADPAVASLSSSVGVDGVNPTLNQGRMLINLKPVGDRAKLASVLAALKQRAGNVPGVELFLQPVQDLTIDTEAGITPYRFSLQGADQGAVTAWGQKLSAALAHDSSLASINANVLGQGRAIIVDINRDAAARLGLSALAVDNALYDAFGQRIVSTIYTQSSQNRVIMAATAPMLANPAGLAQLYIPLPAGGSVPLGTIATIRESSAPLVIAREGQFPAATIGFEPANGVSLGAAVAAIERVEAEIGLPPTVSTDFSGAASAFRTALSGELWLVIAAIVVVYIVLGVLYESFIHPLTILSTLPSAGVGALIALALSGYGLGVIGVIGIVLLIGIVKKNAIMMIDFALAAMREEGMAPEAAIRRAARLRFRPIMMTTFAALFAGIPLILGTGMGHELRQPLGLAIAGGLILSQVLTLFTTPVIFLGFEGLAARWRARNGGAGGEADGVVTAS